MDEQILKFCLEKGILLDKDMFNSLKNLDANIAREIIKKLSEITHEKFITRASFDRNKEIIQSSVSDNEKKTVESLCINLGVRLEITKKISEKEANLNNHENDKKTYQAEDRKDIISNVKVLNSSFTPGRKISVEDFVIHLRARFNELRKILQEHGELNDLVSISKLNGGRQGISIIGMVVNKRITKNKNILLEVEDLTGRTTALINSNKPELFQLSKNIVLDDIIGMKGATNGELFFVNNIIYPDSMLHEKKKLPIEESAAFISDVHIGSKMFLEKNFLRFIDWLNGMQGDEEQMQEALKIKYLFLTGDNVDGVGIYPGQEELLNIKDVEGQYFRLAEILSKIRKDVKIIICPGQHDSVRVAEPQPPLTKEYAGKIYELENVILVSNPSLVEIGGGEMGERGFKVLIYHGDSLIEMINNIEELRMIRAHDTPAKIVKHLLLRRHLAPIHSSVLYVPGEQDSLAIKEVPDIIVTGDLHRPDIDMYNNILVICCSCWQSMTPFEEKVGNHPDPCKVPILNLKTRAIKVLDFSNADE
jgi:DNA polymerase II small subunit